MQGRSPVFFFSTHFFAPVVMAGLIIDEVCHERNRSYLVGQVHDVFEDSAR